MVKRLPTMREIWVQSLGREYLLEKEIATHSSFLAWKIPWTEDPGRLPSMGSQRVGHDWVTSLPSLQWTFIDHRQCRRCCRDTELRIQEASLLQTLEHWDSHVQWMLRYNENRRPDATQGSPGFPKKLKKLPAPTDNFLPRASQADQDASAPDTSRVGLLINSGRCYSCLGYIKLYKRHSILYAWLLKASIY